MFDGKTKMEKACSHFVRRLELGMIDSENRNNEKGSASKRNVENDRSIVRRSGRKRIAQNMTDPKEEEEEEDTFDSLNQGKKASTNVAGKMIKVSKGAKVCKEEELESKQRAVQWTLKKAYKGKKKVGLKVVMSPSYIHPGYSLVISSNWAREQGLLKKQEVELRFEGKTWEAVFFCDASNKLARLTSGWKDFRMDNDLKVGDLCYLNVVRGSSHPVAIDVLISRGTDVKNLILLSFVYYLFEMPRSLKPREFPDFMESFTVQPLTSFIKQTRTLISRTGMVTIMFLETAESHKGQYMEKMETLQSYYGAESEYDNKRYEVKGWFDGACSTDSDEREKLASAWYYVTYHSTYTDKSSNCFGFTWVVGDILMDIKSAAKKREFIE
ncbi:hypothetical protein ACJIZ3_009914 [Penstemon smallii]|uniref:TF-B3 domain-containing protein n=1 Tax=Penstemon smallii TaxID=265156 RepID=A0ABD3TF61_9LAMI